jgi:hypothetical protein
MVIGLKVLSLITDLYSFLGCKMSDIESEYSLSGCNFPFPLNVTNHLEIPGEVYFVFIEY